MSPLRPRTWILIGAVLVSIGSSLFSQPLVIPEAAKKNWYVDEAGDRCFMSHPVEGVGNRRLTVQTYPGSQTYELVLDSDAWPVKAPKVTQGKLEAKPIFGQHWYKMQVDPAGSASGKALRFVEIPGSFLVDLSKAKSIELSNWQMRLSYPVPAGIAAATRALADCQVSKLIEWGADPSAFGTGAIPVQPRGDLKPWFGDDFFDKVKSYHLAVRVKVGADGKAASCDFLRSSVSQREQEVACNSIVKNARFTPAINPAGASVRSIYVINVNLERYKGYEHLPDE